MIQEAAQVASQVAHEGNDMLSTQIGGAMLLAYLLQWAKTSRLVPWVSEHTKTVNYALTGFLALLTSVGVHYQFDSAAGTLTIGGLHFWPVVHGLFDWAKQWAFQQTGATLITTKAVAEQVQAGNAEMPSGITPAPAGKI